MNLSSDIKTAYRCGSCHKDIRLVPREPSNPCRFCDSREWIELQEQDRAKLWSILGKKDHSKARVFVCYVCGKDVRIHWEGEPIDDVPCKDCGSRMFRELLGEHRTRYLATESG